MSTRPHDWLVNQLPSGMVAGDFFRRFVSIFQEEAETLTAHGDNLPHLADPRLAPPSMVRWMATWIGMPEIDRTYPEEVQRRVLLTAAAYRGRRGTPAALRAMLELYSGGPAVVEEGGGVFREGEAPTDDPWVDLRVASTGPLAEADFLTLVLDEVPAHLRARVWVGERLAWPLAEQVDEEWSAA